MDTFTPLGYSIAALSLCMSTLIAGMCAYSVASAISSAVIIPVHLLGVFSIVVMVSSIVYLVKAVIPSKNQDTKVGWKLPRSAAVFLLCASGLLSGGCIYPLALVISNTTIIQVLSAVVGSVCIVVALSSILHLLRSNASAMLKETTSTSSTVTFQESDLSPTFCSDKAGGVQFISSPPPTPTYSPPTYFPYSQTFASPGRNVNISAQGIPYTAPTYSPPTYFPYNQTFASPDRNVNISPQGIPYTTATYSPTTTFPCNQTFASPDRNVNISPQGIPYTAATYSPPTYFPYNQTFASPDRNVNISPQGIPYTAATYSPTTTFPCNQTFTAPSQEQAQQQVKAQDQTQQQARAQDQTQQRTKAQDQTQQQAKEQQEPVNEREAFLKSIRGYSEEAGSRSAEQVENSVRIGKQKTEKRRGIEQSRQVKLTKTSSRPIPKWPAIIDKGQARNMVSKWTEDLKEERSDENAEAESIQDKLERANRIQEIQNKRLIIGEKSKAILECIERMSPQDLTDAIILKMIQGIISVPPATVDSTSYVPPTHSETSTSSSIPLPPPMQETLTSSSIPLPPPMQETLTPSGMPTSSLLRSASLEAPFTPDPAAGRSKEGNFQQGDRNFR